MGRPGWKKASKNERLATQQAQNEIKQMAKKDLDALKEEMKGLQMGSGSTVCSEASWVWEALAPLLGPQLLPPGSMKCSFPDENRPTAVIWKTHWIRLKFHADSSSGKNPSCKLWHPPVCQNYKSEKGCANGDKCHFRHVEAEGKPSKKSKRGAKGSVVILKESVQLGCASQDFYPRQFIPCEEGTSGPKHAVKFSKSTCHQIKIRGKKGFIVRYFRS